MSREFESQRTRSDGVTLERAGGLWCTRFRAMASPCELLVECNERARAARWGRAVADEAWRIERKFSRYRDENIVARINAGRGEPVEVDAETADLLDFADHCFAISDGLFDISSGVLRRIWSFAPGAEPPPDERVAEMLALIGWDRVEWRRPWIRLAPGMQIDLGGIGKEYAVDRAFQRLAGHTEAPFLVNFGGDLRASRSRLDGSPWVAGIEHPDETSAAARTLSLHHGALATSGDVRRSFVHEGVVYGHILSPRTGWPVRDAPRSVTVAAATCTEAGVLATLAMLHGGDAETFLDAQEVKYWSIR